MDQYVEKGKALVKRLVPARILDPAWAFYLSVIGRGDAAASPTQASGPEMKPHHWTHDEPDFLTFEWLRRRVKENADPGLTSYFAIRPDEGAPSLCAPAECFDSLVETIMAIGRRSNLNVGHQLTGERTFASSAFELKRDLTDKRAVRLFLVLGGRELDFFLEMWRIEDNILTAPRPNPVTMKIYLRSSDATPFLRKPGVLLQELYQTPLAEAVTFDIDVVYTWVNSSDPEWQQLISENSPPPSDADPLIGQRSPDPDRYTNRDELRYSLRSLFTFAPWVRHVYVVTNCKPPSWFDESNERVRWVYHDEIIDQAHLPTFNSHAIEASIHHIPTLSEHFLYFNDDLFFLKPMKKSDFFLPNGIAKTRPEPYGLLHGELNPDDPDYINAARNGQRLLETEFAKTVTRLHTHSPQSVTLSVMHACEQTFSEAYEETRSHRFRSISDISPTSFMYPSFAYLTGSAVTDYPLTSLISRVKPYAELFDHYLALMASARHSELPLALCINDGGGSAQDDAWGTAITRFMTTAFFDRCEAEVDADC